MGMVVGSPTLSIYRHELRTSSAKSGMARNASGS
jgi:hypothetical protein